MEPVKNTHDYEQISALKKELKDILVGADLEYSPLALQMEIKLKSLDNAAEDRVFRYATYENDRLHLYENIEDAFDGRNYEVQDVLEPATQLQVLTALTNYYRNENNNVTKLLDKQNVPSYALSAIINGDFSGIDSEEDEKNIRDFMDREYYKGAVFSPRNEQASFTTATAFGPAADCVTVDILRTGTIKQFRDEHIAASQDLPFPEVAESVSEAAVQQELSERLWNKLNELLPENGDMLLLQQPFTITEAQDLAKGQTIDVFNIRRSLSPDYDAVCVFVCGDSKGGVNTYRLTADDLQKVDDILESKDYTLSLKRDEGLDPELREAKGYLMDVLDSARAEIGDTIMIQPTTVTLAGLDSTVNAVFLAPDGNGSGEYRLSGDDGVLAVETNGHTEFSVGKILEDYSSVYALSIAVREAQIKNLLKSFEGHEIYFKEPVAISRDDDDIKKDYVAGVKIDDDGSLNISGHRVDDNGETHVFYHAEDLYLNGYDDLLAKLSEMRQQENVKQEHFLEPFTDEQWKVMSEIGYPYAPGNAKENEAAPIPDMVYWRVAAGMMTKDDAIRVFDTTGYTVGSNPERTIEILSSLNAQYGKLDNNLSPVSVQSIPSEGTVEETVSKEITLYRLGGGFIALGSDASILADKSSGTVNDYSIEDSGEKGEYCFLNRKDFTSLLESGVDLNIRMAGKNVPLETSKVLYYLSTRLVDKQDDTVKKSPEKNDFLNHVLYGNRRSAIGYNLENRINTFMKDNGVDIPWSDLFFETKISRWSDLHQIASRAVESILRESGQGDESLLNSTTAEYVSEKAKSVALDIVSSVHEDEVNFDIHRKEALDAIGYPYSKNTTKPDGSLNLPTTDESLYWEYAAGVISLKDAAREFCRTGWTDFVDERFTERQFAILNAKLGKLDTDLNPLIMSKSRPADSLKNMLDNHFQMREDIGKRIYFTHPIPFENEAGSWRAIDVHCGVKNYEIEDNEGNKIPYDVFGHYEQIAAAVKESTNAPLEHQDFSFRIGRNDYNIVVSSVDGRDRFVAMMSLSGDKNVLAEPTMLDADISRFFIDIKDSSDSAVRVNFGEVVANRHFGDLSRSIRQQEEIVAGYREAGLLGKPIDLVEPIVYEKEMSDNVAEVNDSSHYLSIELYENLENAKENIDPTFFMDKGSKDYRQTMYDSLKETLNVHLEQSAKHAIHDRIINSWQRTFTPNQIDALNRYHQIAVPEVSAKETFSRLLHEVSQEPDVARKPEKWIADTARELDDIAKGQVRDEMQQLKR